jgi:hypothetical protein
MAKHRFEAQVVGAGPAEACSGGYAFSTRTAQNL